MKTFAAALLALTLLAASDPPRISISPRVLFEGGTLHIRCSVPPAKDNRWLDFGVQDYRISGKELAGDAAAITHEMYVEKVPCYVGPAFCAVTDAAGKTRVVTTQYSMAGCEP